VVLTSHKGLFHRTHGRIVMLAIRRPPKQGDYGKVLAFLAELERLIEDSQEPRRELYVSELSRLCSDVASSKKAEPHRPQVLLDDTISKAIIASAKLHELMPLSDLASAFSESLSEDALDSVGRLESSFGVATLAPM